MKSQSVFQEAGSVVLFGKGNDGSMVILAGGHIIKIPPHNPLFKEINHQVGAILDNVVDLKDKLPVRGWTKGEALMAEILGLKVTDSGYLTGDGEPRKGGSVGKAQTIDIGSTKGGAPASSTALPDHNPSGPSHVDSGLYDSDYKSGGYPVPDEVKHDPIGAVSELMSSVGGYLKSVSAGKAGATVRR
jgi:hypothetical protein